MSFKLIGKAFDIPLKGNDKLVFLSLCEYANDDDNTCYPSLTTLMKKATISKSGLAYCLNVLENLNMISRKHRTRKNGSATSTLYTVYPNNILDTKLYNKNRKELTRLKDKDPQSGLDCPQSGLDCPHNGLDKPQSGLPTGEQSPHNGHLEPLANIYNPNINPKLLEKESNTERNTPIIETAKPSKTKSTTKQKEAPEYELPDYVDKEIFKEYLEFRKTVKVPNTTRVVNRLINRIIEEHNNGFNANAMVEKALTNGWKDLFITKQNKAVQPNYGANSNNPNNGNVFNPNAKERLMNDTIAKANRLRDMMNKEQQQQYVNEEIIDV